MGAPNRLSQATANQIAGYSTRWEWQHLGSHVLMFAAVTHLHMCTHTITHTHIDIHTHIEVNRDCTLLHTHNIIHTHFEVNRLRTMSEST